MNWEKLKQKFPNIYEDIRELEKKQKHYSSRNLLEIYLDENKIEYYGLIYGLQKAENNKMIINSEPKN